MSFKNDRWCTMYNSFFLKSVTFYANLPGLHFCIKLIVQFWNVTLMHYRDPTVSVVSLYYKIGI